MEAKEIFRATKVILFGNKCEICGPDFVCEQDGLLTFGGNVFRKPIMYLDASGVAFNESGIEGCAVAKGKYSVRKNIKDLRTAVKKSRDRVNLLDLHR